MDKALGCNCFFQKRKKRKKHRSAMGLLEGSPGYWFRDRSCHGYCDQLPVASDHPNCLLCNSQLVARRLFLVLNFLGHFAKNILKRE